MEFFIKIGFLVRGLNIFSAKDNHLKMIYLQIFFFMNMLKEQLKLSETSSSKFLVQPQLC